MIHLVVPPTNLRRCADSAGPGARRRLALPQRPCRGDLPRLPAALLQARPAADRGSAQAAAVSRSPLLRLPGSRAQGRMWTRNGPRLDPVTRRLPESSGCSDGVAVACRARSRLPNREIPTARSERAPGPPAPGHLHCAGIWWCGAPRWADTPDLGGRSNSVRIGSG